MVKNITSVAVEGQYLAGIVFDSFVGSSSSSLPSTFSYSLRFKSIEAKGPISNRRRQISWDTDREYSKNQFPGPRSPGSLDGGPPNYFDKGFIFLQNAIDSVILNRTGLKASVSVSLERMPYPEYINDTYVSVVLGQQMANFIYFSFIVLAAKVVSSVVQEKEKRLKVRESEFSCKIIIIGC